jgi:flagellar biosynthetic protein FliR
MPVNFDEIQSAFTLFAAPFLRLSGMMVVAPIFSAPGFNFRTRALLAIILAALVAPSLPTPPFDNIFSGRGLFAGITELGVGIIIGFVLQLAFAAAVFAAQAQSMTMGLGFAMAVDPQNGVQVPVVAQFFVILITLLFLTLDAHLALISAVVESYKLIPIGAIGISQEIFSRITALGSIVFVWGMLMALPVLTALLFINIALGVVTRAAPQLNIFAVGFPVTIMSGLLIMIIVMPVYLDVMTRLVEMTVLESLRIFQ